MKNLINTALISICVFTATVNANEEKKTIYVNKHVGFNVEGYKFKQPAYPCDIDINLVEQLVLKGNEAGFAMESVGTKEKIKNGIVPVVLIDIEQLSLRQTVAYGVSKNFNLPKIQINAGVLQGTDLQTAKHTCAMPSKDEYTMPSDNIILNHGEIEICAEARKCIEDLGRDVVEWMKPQLK